MRKDPLAHQPYVDVREPRRCADGLVHLVTLCELQSLAPRKWLRSCDANDDFVRPMSMPTTEPITCVACVAKESKE